MACTGNATEQCGGPNRLNLFHSSKAVVATSGPATNAGPPGWGFLGCYTDSTAARTLTANGASAGGGGALTVALCTQACQTEGYILAGVEYSGECYCGNAASNGGGPAPDGLAGCNMVCNGNSSEYCGGANRLDVYGAGQTSTITPLWSSLGCYTDVSQIHEDVHFHADLVNPFQSVNARTLAIGMAVPGGAANMTVENCQTACQAAKYTLAGVEYAAECYCDNKLENGGGPASDGSAECDMSCNGNPSEICGGPNRLNMYSYAGGATSSATATSTPTTSVSKTATSSTATSTGTGSAASLPKSWTYKGCYVDNTNGRILNQEPDSSTLTVESCVQTCIGLGYSIAGMEYSTQCFCGNYVFDGGYLASQDSDCAMTCGGNSSEICGGPNRMSVYSNSTITTYAAPTAQKTNLPGKWQYQGCLT